MGGSRKGSTLMKHIHIYDRRTKEFINSFIMHEDADATDVYETILKRTKQDNRYSAMTTRSDVDRNIIIEGI